MGDKTGIEWTDATWNPVRGCSRVSEGCRHCYAERVAARFSKPGMPYEGLIAKGGQWNGAVRFVPEQLEQPLRWQRPRRIFVNSMSDLFHESVPDQVITDIFGVMALAHRHTFQVLTKRPERMLQYLANGDHGILAQFEAFQRQGGIGPRWLFRALDEKRRDGVLWQWPLPNVWLGVSVEDQATADERIPLLLQTPAVVRWISAEPLLGPVDLDCWPESGCSRNWLDGDVGLDWVVAGGESGPGSRPMHPDWIRDLCEQCQAARVPFLFKQWGEWEIASAENGHHGSVMPESGERYTWVTLDGKTHNPSAPQDRDDVWAMARVGKKRAGRVLDGRTWDEYPA